MIPKTRKLNKKPEPVAPAPETARKYRKPGQRSAPTAGPSKKTPETALKASQTVSPAGKSSPVRIKALLALSCEQVADLFGITSRSVRDWHETQGCPAKLEGTGSRGRPSLRFDLYEVIAWRLQNETQRGRKELLEAEKLRKARRENDAAEGKLIDRSQMDGVLEGRALSLRNFWERSLPMSRHLRAMKTPEELVAIDAAMVAQLTEAYIGMPVRVDNGVSD